MAAGSNLLLGGLVFLGEVLEHLGMLCGLALFPTTTSFAHLRPAGLGLVAEHLGASVLNLLLVDMFHEDTLVLEHVSLGFHVQGVVQVSVDLFGFSVFFEKTTKHSHASHPQHLDWHTGISGTLPLSLSSMTTLPTSDGVLPYSGTGVNGHWLSDDETILDQFTDVL